MSEAKQTKSLNMSNSAYRVDKNDSAAPQYRNSIAPEELPDHQPNRSIIRLQSLHADPTMLLQDEQAASFDNMTAQEPPLEYLSHNEEEDADPGEEPMDSQDTDSSVLSSGDDENDLNDLSV